MTYRRESHLFISLPLAKDSGSASRRALSLHLRHDFIGQRAELERADS